MTDDEVREVRDRGVDVDAIEDRVRRFAARGWGPVAWRGRRETGAVSRVVIREFRSRPFRMPWEPAPAADAPQPRVIEIQVTLTLED